MDIKNTNAAQTTKTYNRDAIENQTENIYEAISIISKRIKLKDELLNKYQKLRNSLSQDLLSGRKRVTI